MARILTDKEIADLFCEKKPLKKSAIKKLGRLKQKRNRPDSSASIKFKSECGNRFRLIARQNNKRETSFSIIFQLLPRRGGAITLVRCNGHHAPHPNQLEGTEIPADTCHVHTITERYQKIGKPVWYAEPTSSFSSYLGAINFIAWKFGMFVEDEESGELFAED
jgi:hypothetical protein